MIVYQCALTLFPFHRSHAQARVDALIEDAARGHCDTYGAPVPPPPASMRLPLIRLRVEHTGFDALPAARFGASFINRVANPDDMLHFYRRAAPRGKAVAAGAGAGAAAAAAAALVGAGGKAPAPAALGIGALEEFVADALQATAGRGLVTMPTEQLSTAVIRFANGENGAIREAIDEVVVNRTHATAAHERVAGASLMTESTKFLKTLVAAANKEMTDAEEAEIHARGPEAAAARAEARLAAAMGRQSDGGGSEGGGGSGVAPKKRAPAKKAAAAGGAKKAPAKRKKKVRV